MTLVSEIIKRAYREINIIPLVSDPSAAQSTEALNLLNSLIASTVGYESGDELLDINYGGDFDQSAYIIEWVPDNTRLVLNLSASAELDADPEPYEGQRLAVIDAGANLATYNLVINGNGRKIEGASSVTLSTNSEGRHWMYRADTANWVKIETLDAADEMPLPIEYDDYFVIGLTMRLAPRYGLPIPPESFDYLKRMRSQIRSRYRRKTFDMQPDPGLLGPYEYGYQFEIPTRSFNTGRLWPWWGAR